MSAGAADSHQPRLPLTDAHGAAAAGRSMPGCPEDSPTASSQDTWVTADSGSVCSCSDSPSPHRACRPSPGRLSAPACEAAPASAPQPPAAGGPPASSPRAQPPGRPLGRPDADSSACSARFVGAGAEPATPGAPSAVRADSAGAEARAALEPAQAGPGPAAPAATSAASPGTASSVASADLDAALQRLGLDGHPNPKAACSAEPPDPAASGPPSVGMDRVAAWVRATRPVLADVTAAAAVPALGARPHDAGATGPCAERAPAAAEQHAAAAARVAAVPTRDGAAAALGSGAAGAAGAATGPAAAASPAPGAGGPGTAPEARTPVARLPGVGLESPAEACAGAPMPASAGTLAVLAGQGGRMGHRRSVQSAPASPAASFSSSDSGAGGAASPWPVFAWTAGRSAGRAARRLCSDSDSDASSPARRLNAEPSEAAEVAPPGRADDPAGAGLAGALRELRMAPVPSEAATPAGALPARPQASPASSSPSPVAAPDTAVRRRTRLVDSDESDASCSAARAGAGRPSPRAATGPGCACTREPAGPQHARGGSSGAERDGLVPGPAAAQGGNARTPPRVRRGPAELFGAGFVQGPGAPAAPAAPDPYLFPGRGGHGSGGASPIALSSSDGEGGGGDGAGGRGCGEGGAWTTRGARRSAPSLCAHLRRVLGWRTQRMPGCCMTPCAGTMSACCARAGVIIIRPPWNISSCVWVRVSSVFRHPSGLWPVRPAQLRRAAAVCTPLHPSTLRQRCACVPCSSPERGNLCARSASTALDGGPADAASDQENWAAVAARQHRPPAAAELRPQSGRSSPEPPRRRAFQAWPDPAGGGNGAAARTAAPPRTPAARKPAAACMPVCPFWKCSARTGDGIGLSAHFCSATRFNGSPFPQALDVPGAEEGHGEHARPLEAQHRLPDITAAGRTRLLPERAGACQRVRPRARAGAHAAPARRRARVRRTRRGAQRGGLQAAAGRPCGDHVHRVRFPAPCPPLCCASCVLP